jgi:hypothetical protein
MGSIETGNDRTHELLDVLANRVDRIAEYVRRLDRSAPSAVSPNLPIDPNNYRNHVLEDNQAIVKRLLPMESDEIILEFDKCLEDSATEANDKGTPDRVCFYPFS